MQVVQLDQTTVSRFHQLLFRWYRQNQRDLPWRETHDPYKILVSEVMLQQTQVPRVVPKYLTFIGRYPTAAVLAQAKISDILRLWSGLGYNRRAIYLKRAAEIIADKWKNRWPETVPELQQLPGVGQYTASAILSFAFKKDIPLADTNIEKVIGRIFIGPDWPHLTEKELLQVVKEVLPRGKSWIFPHALMDLGAALARKDPSMVVWHKEFPELFIKEPRTDNKQVPWLGSSRQVRGAILRQIQQGSTSLSRLSSNLQVSRDRLEGFVQALAREGLVSRVRGKVSLP